MTHNNDILELLEGRCGSGLHIVYDSVSLGHQERAYEILNAEALGLDRKSRHCPFCLRNPNRRTGVPLLGAAACKGEL
jgi:hypothetical protein